MVYLTNEELRNRLQLLLASATYADVARGLGVSISHVADVVKGKRPVSPKMAKGLGYKKVVLFEQSNPPQEDK